MPNRWEKILVVVFAMHVVSVLVSQSAMDFTSILLGGIVLGRREFRLSWFEFFRKFPLRWVVLGWALVFFVSSLTNQLGWEHALKSFVDFKWFLFFSLVAWVWSKDFFSADAAVEFFAKSFIFANAFAIVAFFLDYDIIKGPQFRVTPVDGGIRTGGFYSNPMTLAHVYGFFSVALLGWFLSQYVFGKKRDLLRGKNLFVVLALAMSFVTLMMTYTRGAWIAVAAGIFLQACWVGWGIRIFMAGTSVVLAAASFWTGFRERILSLYWGNSYNFERLWIWKANWRMFLDHPWLGVGMNENKILISDYYSKIQAPEGLLQDHAHNQMLQYLVTSGIPGFLLSLSFFLSILYFVWRVFRTSDSTSELKDLALAALGAHIMLIVGGLAEANFDHSKVRYAAILVWASVLGRFFRKTE